MINQQTIAREKRRKKYLCSLILFILCIGMISASRFYLRPQYADMRKQLSNTASMTRQIRSVELEAESYQQTIEASGKEFGDLFVEKNSYVEFIGQVIKQNQLNINKMTVDDTMYSSNGVNTLRTEIELQGDLYDIKNMVQQLYDSKIAARIDSFSYRLQDGQEEYPWMWRSIDDRSLVGWWSAISVPQNQSVQDSLTEAEEYQPVGADDLLRHGTALCYIVLNILGS